MLQEISTIYESIETTQLFYLGVFLFGAFMIPQFDEGNQEII